jgi:PDZ domain
MNQRLLPLLPLLALAPLWLPCALAKDKTKDLPPPTEPPTQLEKMEVKTNPFADWGFDMNGPISPWNKLRGGPPQAMFVSSVYSQSPADIAGVQLGDEVTAINGKKMTELPFRALLKHFHNTERGDEVTLELYNRATKQRRNVVLKIKSNKSWDRKDGSGAFNCWGLVVSVGEKIQPTMNVRAAEKCIVGWECKPVVDGKKKKKPAEAAGGEPEIVLRRSAIWTWAKQSVRLVEVENHCVTVIDLGADGAGARMVRAGATLTLKVDGTYEIQEPPPKSAPDSPPETAAESAVSTPSSPAPAAPAQP